MASTVVSPSTNLSVPLSRSIYQHSRAERDETRRRNQALDDVREKACKIIPEDRVECIKTREQEMHVEFYSRYGRFEDTRRDAVIPELVKLFGPAQQRSCSFSFRAGDVTLLLVLNG